MKWPMLLTRLRTPRQSPPQKMNPPPHRLVAAPGAENEAFAQSILAALEIQSSPIFQLPDELFLEIFAYFPILEWSDLYYRYSHAWYTPIPNVFGERTKALLALSATCKAMRYRFLQEVWERNLLCLESWRRSHQIPVRLRIQCKTLMGDRFLATYVRTMTVDLACDGTKEILKTFARCLAVLPNLHTLEVVSMAVHYSQYLHTALRGVKLPQIRTLILPSRAHHLLRHCPNVDDLTCTPFSPDEKFVESLAKGRQKLRRFAVLFPTNATIWTRLARTCPDISELSVVFCDNIPRETLNCITTLSNLSTLQIIYVVPYHDIVPVCGRRRSSEVFREQARYRSAHKERTERESEGRWNEMKDMAVEHLKSCSGPGPKIFRTIVLDHDWMSGTHFHCAARTDEVQVWK